MPAASSAVVVVVAAGVLAAAIVDLRTRRIPNTLTAAMAVLGVGLAVAGLSGVAWPASLAGLALGAALMMPGHLLGGTGAGDVKLMAAVGAVAGPATVVNAFLFTALAGGVLALAVAARRQRLGATMAVAGRLAAGSAVARAEVQSAAPVRRFAYGPAIAVGSAVAVLIR